MQHVDLNADVGEGTGNDAAVMEHVTSANIACGGHAGDKITMRTTARLAKQYGVSIGAHPSYPDREGFGPVHRQMLEAALAALDEQLSR